MLVYMFDYMHANTYTVYSKRPADNAFLFHHEDIGILGLLARTVYLETILSPD